MRISNELMDLEPKEVTVKEPEEDEVFQLYPKEKTYSPPKGFGNQYRKNLEMQMQAEGRNNFNREFENNEQEQSPAFYEEVDIQPIEVNVERFSIPKDSFSYPDPGKS